MEQCVILNPKFRTLIHFKQIFQIDLSVTYLNFGSFGNCPRPIFEKYQEYQKQLEWEPVRFIVYEGMDLLRESRSRLGAYINCSADDVAFMTNPSYATNTIARSLKLNTGDEILSTNLEYGAADRAWEYYCKNAGAKYVRAEISLPILSKEAFLEDFWKECTPKTKAVFISHITSATGLILPVEEVVKEARSRGLLTIVDGAHVPGQIGLDIEALGADIYIGACHKWMMAPKGASFLYVNMENQHWVDPLVISWGYRSDNPSHSQFLDYHQTNGTRDFSAFLTIPDCIDFMEEYNWTDVSAKCRRLLLSNAERFCRLAGTEPISELNQQWLAQLFSIPIRTSRPAELQKKLFDDYRIEIPVTNQNGRYYIRFSIQAYNGPEDLDRLEEAIREIKQNSALIQ